MTLRSISDVDVRHVLETGIIIERYNATPPNAEYLIIGWIGTRPLHVVGKDITKEGITLVVTAYEPNVSEWKSDFKGRKS